jgi:hypothetical protein
LDGLATRGSCTKICLRSLKKSPADLRRKLVSEYPSREDGPILSREYSLCDLCPNERTNAVPKA